MSLSFEVKNIPPEGLRVKGSLAIKDLDLQRDGITFPGPLTYSLMIRIVTGEFIATGTFSQPARMQCSRCLRPIEREISIKDYSYNVQVGEAQIIDLTPSIREDIMFALPLKPLCKEDCKGMCPTCGKNLNSGSCSCTREKGDERWSALENLELPSEDT